MSCLSAAIRDVVDARLGGETGSQAGCASSTAVAAALSRQRRFVFPSQLAADVWRGDTLLRRAQSEESVVVPVDRFISWDSFKERVSSGHSDSAPANASLRRLLARSLARENARAPFLKRIVPTDVAEDSLLFADYIRAGIPGLKTLCDRSSELSPELADDVQELRSKYSQLLEQGDYFEPAWTPSTIETAGVPYTVFFPELLEDWSEFEPKIEGNPDIDTVNLPPGEPITLAEYEDSIHELRSLFDRVEALIEGGVSIESIVVTCCELDISRDDIEREARRRALPVDIHAGVTLADHPAGQIFSRISACVERNFDPDAVKRLICDTVIRWKEPEEMQLLMRFGLDHGCVSGAAAWRAVGWAEAFASGGGRTFARRLEACRLEGRTVREPDTSSKGRGEVISETPERRWPTVASLERLFGRFEKALRDIVRAPDFAALRTAVSSFLESFVDTSAWGSRVEPVFQRCMLTLSEWRETADRSGVSVDDPFSLFLGSLGEAIYVSQDRRGGVPVYPYRVAAGICAEHHFIVGASRSATAIPVGRLPFLREDEREKLEAPGAAADAASAFLRAYAGSGETVSFSCAKRSLSGVQIAPNAHTVVAQRQPGAYEAERAFFSGSPLFRPRYPVQRDGWYAARHRVLHSKGDLRRTRLPRKLREKSLQRLIDDTDRLDLSPSRLERYVSAPFSFYLEEVLGIEENEWCVSLFDPAFEGGLLHSLIQAAEQALANARTPYGSMDLVGVSEIVDAELERLLSRNAVSASVAPALLLRMQRASLRVDALRTLQRLSKLFPDAIPESQELPLRGTPVPDLILSGRIDSLSRSGDRIILVDYKRSSGGIPSAEQIRTFMKPQLPLYTLLAEAHGLPPNIACYLEVHDSERIVVAVGEMVAVPGGRAKKPAIPTEQWSEFQEELSRWLSDARDCLFQGKFSCENPWLGCEQCRTRSLCRAKYGHREAVS